MRHCVAPGCPAIVEQGRCPRHQRKEADRPNPQVRAWYRSPAWRQLRAIVLRAQPCCVAVLDGRCCGRPATDVDHIRAHSGDAGLFWNRANLQGLCHECHARKTRSEARLVGSGRSVSRRGFVGR
jgi:5-methylcytosine-specific restriction protein A